MQGVIVVTPCCTFAGLVLPISAAFSVCLLTESSSLQGAVNDGSQIFGLIEKPFPVAPCALRVCLRRFLTNAINDLSLKSGLSKAITSRTVFKLNVSLQVLD